MIEWGIGKNILFMISIGIGYLVLYFAKREEKNLQILGYILGSLMIIYSIICILLNLIIFSASPRPRFPYRMMKPYYRAIPPGSQIPQPAK